jgi:hypothetical protein
MSETSKEGAGALQHSVKPQSKSSDGADRET